MAEFAGKMPVDKLAEWREQKLLADLLSELYPPLAPDAPELTHGLDEADWWPESDDGTG